MEIILKEKLDKEEWIYNDEEVLWLLENIGNENPVIRDDLVFLSFSNGLLSGGFEINQYNMIKDFTISNNLICFNLDKQLPYTLTRSFSALLNGFLIETDGNSNSIYYHLLNSDERLYFFKSATQYLVNERDKTGFSTKYGWVHALAHGGDFLSKVVSHDLFPKEMHDTVFSSLSQFVNQTTEIYKEREECRVAHVLLEGFSKGVFQEREIICWVDSLSFKFETRSDYYRYEMFKHMLAYFYFHTYNKIDLSKELEISIMNYLEDF